MEQAMLNPAAGRQINVPMTDLRWPAGDGWVKMTQKREWRRDSLRQKYENR
jgi:hypothetical protein